MTENAEGTNPKDRVGSAKVPLHLIPPVSKVYQALAMADGAYKYDPYNWRETKVRMTVYIDAIERHLDALKDGEDFAPDSTVHHLGHILAGAGIMVDALEAGTLVDDRPHRGKGSASRVHAKVVNHPTILKYASRINDILKKLGAPMG